MGDNVQRDPRHDLVGEQKFKNVIEERVDLRCGDSIFVSGLLERAAGCVSPSPTAVATLREISTGCALVG